MRRPFQTWSIEWRTIGLLAALLAIFLAASIYSGGFRSSVFGHDWQCTSTGAADVCVKDVTKNAQPKNQGI